MCNLGIWGHESVFCSLSYYWNALNRAMFVFCSFSNNDSDGEVKVSSYFTALKHKKNHFYILVLYVCSGMFQLEK